MCGETGDERRSRMHSTSDRTLGGRVDIKSLLTIGSGDNEIVGVTGAI